MRSSVFPSDFSNKFLLAGLAAMLVSIPLLTAFTQDVFADPDKFGIEELYPTTDGGPVWFLNNEQPEADDNFLITSANNIELEEEDSDSFALDAETGTEKHGVRLHANSPDGEWKNVEMTGYFKLDEGNDQFTLIARQGPTYNEDGGCGAYGYYGMLSANGDAYFKKKLFHHGGYTDRTAVRQGVVGDLNDRWVGIKMIAYNLDGGDVKLELWVDDGDETNDWQKATEYVDDGSWEVAGSGCGRDGDETIDEGTRGGFRVDDSQFEFKKLSIRDIVGSGDAAEAALMAEGEAAADEGEAEEVAVIEGTEDSDLLTVEIVSNGVESIVPATFRFSAHITGGTEPYTISWDFGDRSEDSDEQSVEHTFDEAGTYNVAVAVTDSDGETASDSLEITVEEATPAEEEATPAEEEATPAEEEATPAEEEATPAEEEEAE
jgi:hypothetical protein